jgi:hypothetical protein
MPIRKGRLGKICIRCNKTFIPTGKTNKVCEKCHAQKQFKWLSDINRKRVNLIMKIEMDKQNNKIKKQKEKKKVKK